MYNSDMCTANLDSYLPLNRYISIAFLSVSSEPPSASFSSSRFIHSHGFTRNTKNLNQNKLTNKKKKSIFCSPESPNILNA